MRRLLRILFLLSPSLAGLGLFVFAPATERSRKPSLSATSRPSEIAGYHFTGRTMGCDWSLRVGGSPPAYTPTRFRASIQHILDEAEQQLSTWQKTSDLSRFNEAQGTDWYPVPEDLARAANDALHLSEITSGAFDPTVGPLVDLWGFGRDHPAGPFGTIPTERQIASAMERVGHRQLHARLHPPALRKDRPDVRVDFSAYGKGDAVDRVGQWLEGIGIKDYLMSVAGENRAKGRSPAGGAWIIGIESPDGQGILQSLPLQDQSIATSGVGRNRFQLGSKTYTHLINPRTGRPIDSDILSVTVLHASAARASVLALAIAVMGPEQGLAFADRNDVPALIIRSVDGRLREVPSRTWPGAYNSSDADRTDQNPPVGRPD